MAPRRRHDEMIERGKHVLTEKAGDGETAIMAGRETTREKGVRLVVDMAVVREGD